jgi:hypothetical protein
MIADRDRTGHGAPAVGNAVSDGRFAGSWPAHCRRERSFDRKSILSARIDAITSTPDPRIGFVVLKSFFDAA